MSSVSEPSPEDKSVSEPSPEDKSDSEPSPEDKSVSEPSLDKPNIKFCNWCEKNQGFISIFSAISTILLGVFSIIQTQTNNDFKILFAKTDSTIGLLVKQNKKTDSLIDQLILANEKSDIHTGLLKDANFIFYNQFSVQTKDQKDRIENENIVDRKDVYNLNQTAGDLLMFCLNRKIYTSDKKKIDSNSLYISDLLAKEKDNLYLVKNKELYNRWINGIIKIKSISQNLIEIPYFFERRRSLQERLNVYYEKLAKDIRVYCEPKLIPIDKSW